MTLPVSNDDPATRPIDWSTTLPAGIVRKVVALDPDCDSVSIYNPGDTAMQFSRSSAIALDGTVQPGDYVLAPGATMSLPGGGEVFAHCSAARLVNIVVTRRQRKSRRSIGIMNSKSFWVADNPVVTAGEVSRTYHIFHQVRTDCDISDLELVFGGWGYGQGAGETNWTTLPTSFSADLEYPLNTQAPIANPSLARGPKSLITFGGAENGTALAGELTIADVEPMPMTKGSWFKVNVNVVWPAGSTIVPYALGAIRPGQHIDSFTSGNVVMRAGGINNNNANTPFAPLTILATCSIDAPKSLVAYVTSIGEGGTGGGDMNNCFGWPQQLAAQLGVPLFSIGRGGASIVDFVGPESANDARPYSRRLAKLLALLRPTHQWIEAATNDLANGATVPQARAGLGKLRDIAGGIPCAIGTVPPRCTASTDGYTSIAGQMRIPSFAISEAYNTEIKTLAGFDVIDVYSAVAAPGGGSAYGYWAVDGAPLVGDGVHPNAVGEARIVADRACRAQAWAALQR